MTQARSILALARAPAAAKAASTRLSLSSSFRAVIAIAIGMLALGYWSATTVIDAVTRISGEVATEADTVSVQHLDGGVIEEILVEEGAQLLPFQPILRLAASDLEFERENVVLERDALRARVARLSAAAARKPMRDIADGGQDPGAWALERALLIGQEAELQHDLESLTQQIVRKRLEASEVTARRDLIARELELERERAQSLEQLSRRGTVSRNEVISSLRTLRQLERQEAEAQFRHPRLLAEIAELEASKAARKAEYEVEQARELADTRHRLNQTEERLRDLEQRLRRTTVRAPRGGILNELHTTAPGEVVRPGQTIASIVPASNELAVEARLPPSERSSVWPGQSAMVKITAYDFASYGGLGATVLDISADAVRDGDGQRYFRVRLELDSIGFGPDRPVLPGMTAEVDLLHRQRTLFDVLTAPVRRLSLEALRER